MRVLCPHCREETVECADIVFCTQPIYEWEIGPDGQPAPSDYGMPEPGWDSAYPEDPDKPYICVPCYKYLSAAMLIVEQDDDTTPTRST